jgi:glucose-6-phosphate isomerase
MTTLTVHPVSEDQETAIRLLLDALHVDYKATEDTDETEYLLSSPANAEHLKKSIEQGQKGEVTNLSLDDIWKA